MSLLYLIFQPGKYFKGGSQDLIDQKMSRLIFFSFNVSK